MQLTTLVSYLKFFFRWSHLQITVIYYLNTNEIPGERLRENMISSHVARSPFLSLRNKSRRWKCCWNYSKRNFVSPRSHVISSVQSFAYLCGWPLWSGPLKVMSWTKVLYSGLHLVRSINYVVVNSPVLFQGANKPRSSSLNSKKPVDHGDVQVRVSSTEVRSSEKAVNVTLT